MYKQICTDSKHVINISGRHGQHLDLTFFKQPPPWSPPKHCGWLVVEVLCWTGSALPWVTIESSCAAGVAIGLRP